MIFLTFYKFSGIPFKYQALEENYVTIKILTPFPNLFSITTNHMKTREIYIWWKKMKRNTRDTLEVLVNNTEENIDINIQKNEKFECLSSQLRKLKCIEKVVGKYQDCP